MIKKLESNMNFIFDENIYYSIEEDNFYNKITSRYGAKVCDFIIKKEKDLLFIEAKSSAPKDKQELNIYIQEISQKFLDSILIYLGVVFERKNTISKNINNNMKNKKFLEGSIKLVIVINGLPKKSLQDIQNVFQKIMRKLVYIFSINSIIVMNNEQAKSKGLVL